MFNYAAMSNLFINKDGLLVSTIGVDTTIFICGVVEYKNPLMGDAVEIGFTFNDVDLPF